MYLLRCAAITILFAVATTGNVYIRGNCYNCATPPPPIYNLDPSVGPPNGENVPRGDEHIVPPHGSHIPKHGGGQPDYASREPRPGQPGAPPPPPPPPPPFNNQRTVVEYGPDGKPRRVIVRNDRLPHPHVEQPGRAPARNLPGRAHNPGAAAGGHQSRVPTQVPAFEPSFGREPLDAPRRPATGQDQAVSRNEGPQGHPLDTPYTPIESPSKQSVGGYNLRHRQSPVEPRF